MHNSLAKFAKFANPANAIRVNKIFDTIRLLFTCRRIHCDADLAN